jgi:hypothetical protein
MAQSKLYSFFMGVDLYTNKQDLTVQERKGSGISMGGEITGRGLQDGRF